MRVGAGQRGTVDIDVDVVRRRVTNQSIDSEQFPSFSPEAGITVGPLGVPSLVQVSAGFAWREPTQFPVVLPASLGFDGLDIETELPILIVANFSPRTFVGGVTVDVEAFPAAKTRLSLDAVYGMWSEAPAPFLVTSLKLAGAGVSRLGVDGALDAPAEGQERAIAPGFRDTVSVRGGVEVKVLDDKLALRGGYQYRPSPVPDQTSGTNIIDPNAHIASVGLGVKVTLPWGLLAHPFDVDFAYQAQIFAPRTAVKESSDDPVGNWTASGAVSAGSIGVRYAF
jgi:hypothetical protein